MFQIAGIPFNSIQLVCIQTRSGAKGKGRTKLVQSRINSTFHVLNGVVFEYDYGLAQITQSQWTQQVQNGTIICQFPHLTTRSNSAFNSNSANWANFDPPSNSDFSVSNTTSCNSPIFSDPNSRCLGYANATFHGKRRGIKLCTFRSLSVPSFLP